MAETASGKQVTFTLHAPDARAVSVAGSFNDWQPDATPLKRGRDGTWKVRIRVAPGAHEYRFCVDGEWSDDPAAEERVPNPFGGANCVRTV